MIEDEFEPEEDDADDEETIEKAEEGLDDVSVCFINREYSRL